MERRHRQVAHPVTQGLLLDTHILARWLIEPGRLSREQAKALDNGVQRGVSIAISAMSLVEIAMLAHENRIRLHRGLDDFFDRIEESAVVQLLPISYAIASQAGSLIALRDPADRVIVATAMVHRLRLVTSDQRIIRSQVVPVID